MWRPQASRREVADDTMLAVVKMRLPRGAALNAVDIVEAVGHVGGDGVDVWLGFPPSRAALPACV